MDSFMESSIPPIISCREQDCPQFCNQGSRGIARAAIGTQAVFTLARYAYKLNHLVGSVARIESHWRSSGVDNV